VVEAEEAAFNTHISEIKKKFQIKLNAAKNKNKPEDAALTKVRAHGVSSSSAASSISMLAMFFLGLLLGGGAAYYFWDLSKKSDKRFDDERTKLLADKRALEDSVSLLQDNFSQLATGKMPSLPYIDNQLSQIQAEYAQKKKAVEAEYIKSKDKLIRKIPAGTKLDHAVERLENEKKQQLEELTSAEAARSETPQKEKTLLKELLGR
jgi:hypothetical protein